MESDNSNTSNSSDSSNSKTKIIKKSKIFNSQVHI